MGSCLQAPTCARTRRLMTPADPAPPAWTSVPRKPSWNKFAANARENAFHPRAELLAPLLADLARLEDNSFREVFAGSPVKRIGRNRFVRNVMIAIGNSGASQLSDLCIEILDDTSGLVRGAAAWALGELAVDAFEAQRLLRYDAEPDPAVREEWDAGRQI